MVSWKAFLEAFSTVPSTVVSSGSSGAGVAEASLPLSSDAAAWEDWADAWEELSPACSWLQP